MKMVLNFSSLCVCICLLAAAVIPETFNKVVEKDPLSDVKHNEGGEHKEAYDHDAFLGKDQAPAFKELTPEESKERLQKLLPKIDKDADGIITEDELKDHIRYMQKRYIYNDVDRTWKGHPHVDDGLLTWKEYRSSIYGADIDNPERPLEPEYKRMLGRDETRWKAADKSGDNALDKDEYACFMHPEDCEHMKDIVVQETVEDIDKNKDGFVDLDEYIHDMYRPDDKEKNSEEPDWVNSERQMFKQFRDKNNDGKLDKEEMREWIMPTNFDHAEAEAKHLISMADEDKDGKLTNKEVLEHYDVFVGSQVTDYGEQLHKHDPSEL